MKKKHIRGRKLENLKKKRKQDRDIRSQKEESRKCNFHPRTVNMGETNFTKGEMDLLNKRLHHNPGLNKEYRKIE